MTKRRTDLPSADAARINSSLSDLDNRIETRARERLFIDPELFHQVLYGHEPSSMGVG
jgi:hypothetical protein